MGRIIPDDDDTLEFDEDGEPIIDPDGEPAWLHLLTAAQRAWRTNEVMKGRNPDEYLEQQLREAKLWPPDAA